MVHEVVQTPDSPVNYDRVIVAKKISNILWEQLWFVLILSNSEEQKRTQNSSKRGFDDEIVRFLGIS